ncbi:MAG: tetratricopeptide repeat protein [Candidatus Eisenbacteria bacterium]|uniref:Tetratricopeptide repeat protein n=1 Tax=Eiseniibacteriota bacterium TaxID=2212470 RepID=A0A956M0S7_UNCEI|nr:tetratricopeptide repeat protein [Candidatus Eisenbacteria bacterium]
MRQSVRHLAGLLALVASLSACAGTGPDALLRSHDYPAAISAYEAAEQRSPDDGEIKRNLGVAYLESGDSERALAKLEEARAIRPQDPRVYFFLAEAHEAVGDLEGALLSYDDYLSVGGRNEVSLQLRVRELARRRAEQEIAKALVDESERSGATDSTTLAVPEFANISGSVPMAPLAKGLAAVTITDLRKVEGFRIVERERWNVLKSELQLAYQRRDAAQSDTTTGGESGVPTAEDTTSGITSPSGSEAGTPQPASGELAEEAAIVDSTANPGAQVPTPTFEEDESGLVDPETAPVLGRVLGAGTVIQGLFTVFGDSDIQLDAAVVDVPTSATTIAGEPVVGSVPEVLHLEKQLVYQILEALGVKPTPGEREEIDALVVEDPASFFEYCRALALQDQGDYPAASRIFRALLDKEPEFAQQMNLVRQVSRNREDFSALEHDELEDIAGPGSGDPAGFLDDLAVSVGNGPGPSGDGSGPEDDDATDVTITDVEKVEENAQTIPDFPPPPGGRR